MFPLKSRNVMISANTFTTFFFFETDVFNFSTIEVKFFSRTNVVIFFKINTTEIKNFFKYTVSMFLSKINEILYSQRENFSNFLNRFDFMCENYEFFEIDKIKKVLWYCEKKINKYFWMLTKFNNDFDKK